MTRPGHLDRVRAEIRNRRFSYRTGIPLRHHAHPGTLQRAIEKAARFGGIGKPVSTRALRRFYISSSETPTEIERRRTVRDPRFATVSQLLV